MSTSTPGLPGDVADPRHEAIALMANRYGRGWSKRDLQRLAAVWGSRPGRQGASWRGVVAGRLHHKHHHKHHEPNGGTWLERIATHENDI
jgi:hypothetical protein